MLLHASITSDWLSSTPENCFECQIFQSDVLPGPCKPLAILPKNNPNCMCWVLCKSLYVCYIYMCWCCRWCSSKERTLFIGLCTGPMTCYKQRSLPLLKVFLRHQVIASTLWSIRCLKWHRWQIQELLTVPLLSQICYLFKCHCRPLDIQPVRRIINTAHRGGG